MFSRLLRALTALSLLSLLVPPGSALAHDSVPAGDYEIVYGWLVEPPVAGQPNALTLSITRSGHSHGESDSHTESGSHGHSDAALTITSPADGATISGDQVDVTVAASGAISDEIHWHLYLDDTLVTMAELAEPTYRLTGLSDGRHVIKAMLADGDHADVGEAAAITIHVTGSDAHGHGSEAVEDIDVSGLRLEVAYGGQTMLLALRPLGNEPGQYQARLTPTRAGVYTLRMTGSIGESPIDVEVQPEEVAASDPLVFPEAQASLTEVREQLAAAQARAQAAQAIAIAAIVLGVVGAGAGLAAMLRRR